MMVLFKSSSDSKHSLWGEGGVYDKNYFKIAWKYRKTKGYSGINIVGLAIGIAACLLILQYVSFELSYESFHTNKDRIYRVQLDRYDTEIGTQWAAGAYAAGNSFKDAIPEIEDYVKLVGRDPVIAELIIATQDQ